MSEPTLRGLGGKVALVVGATGGWGQAASYGLAARGVKVVVSSRTASSLAVLAETIRERGGDATGIAGDITTLAGARALTDETVETYGGLDILVNAAGGTTRDRLATGGLTTSLSELTEEGWNLMIGVELNGVFTCTKAASEWMIEHGRPGRIINVAGGAGMYGSPSDGAHAAAKGGVASAVWSWSAHLMAHGITINCIRGGVRSELTTDGSMTRWNAVLGPDGTDDARAMGFFEPEDVAPLVVWLASDDAADVTACYIGVDGPKLSVWEPKLPELEAYHFPRWTPEEIGRVLHAALPRHQNRPHPSDLLTTDVDLSAVRTSLDAAV